MNFLAHIYLSREHDEIKIGNFMADVLKGNSYLTHSDNIQKGVELHRAIDYFSDNHPVFRQTKHRLHPIYGHYSGVITDMYYDYCLAKNFADYHPQPLEDYVQAFYILLQTHWELLPDKIQRMSRHMIANNWLVSYKTLEGMQTIFYQMDYRSKFKSNMKNATQELSLWEAEINAEFKLFFKDILAYTKDFLDE